MKKRAISAILPIIILFMFSCGDSNPLPKPRAFFRISLPEHTYRMFDSVYPYSFEYPTYAVIVPDTVKSAEPYWINLDFPKFKGRLHISYKFVKNNLRTFTEDARTMAMKHISMSNEINEDIIIDNPAQKVYGQVYEIGGTGAASPYQFYVTDSASSFVRAALYFNIKPNNDSLAPVIKFIKQDINHMISTFKWKKN